jgi:anti-anti-sigma regulatory factor
MAAISVLHELETVHLVEALLEARKKLDCAEGEILLDFSAVRRIDPTVLSAMEELAGLAERKAIKLVLQGVKVEVYKVLKVLKLASRFSYRD